MEKGAVGRSDHQEWTPKRRMKLFSWDSSKGEGKRRGDLEVIYSIDDNPPWYLAIILGLQHYLTMIGACISIPFVLSPFLCIANNGLALSRLISTIFFCSGVATLLQATLGVRLPIVQGGTFTFITPTIAILSLHGECGNSSSEWKDRIVEVQGAIMVSSVFQIVLGLCGGVGFLLRFIGPLTVTPAVTLVGLSLFGAASNYASASWPITAFGIVSITLFSQVLSRLSLCGLQIFKLFPVVFGMGLTWLLCFILTEANVLSDDPNDRGFRARTDSNSDVLSDSNWFRVPYPCQWGTPKVTAAGVFGMLAGVLAGMVESVGDYFACARLSGAPVPTVSAINRGMLVEGLGCLLAGLIGTGNGTTSYSENIGAIGITKVGSRRVIVFGAMIMVLVGCLSKVGALFASLPDPVIGANFFCMFGMITAVGLSNLQFVNLNNSRNLYILGFSLFAGLSLPQWIAQNPNYVDTGNDEADQIIEVLLSTGMFIGGLCGCVLDNLIPGSAEDRGVHKWRRLQHSSLHPGSDTRKPSRTSPANRSDKKSSKRPISATDHSTGKPQNRGYKTQATATAGVSNISTYDIPYITKYLDRIPLARFIPICPIFMRPKTPDEDDSERGRGEEDEGGFYPAIMDEAFTNGKNKACVYTVTSM